MADRTFYLVDGSAYIFRAFHALPPMTRPSDGVPVNAVYGYANMMMRLIAEIKTEYLAVVFDASGQSFRNDLYDLYKANRDEPPEDLRPQFALVREATDAFSVPRIELEGFEADDIIATFCRQAREAGDRAVIVSSDKDLMQLVGNGVTMLDPMKQKQIDVDGVLEKFGVTPDRVVDVQALAGDSVDNVPGVPGIGIKTAAQLINEYGDLDQLLAQAENIKQPKRRQSLIDHAEMARLSRSLVQLDTNVDLPLALNDLHHGGVDGEKLTRFLRDQGFRTIVTRAKEQFSEVAAVAEATAVSTDLSDQSQDEGDDAPSPDLSIVTGPAEYHLIQDEAALQSIIDAALEAGIVAVDTETTSLTATQAHLVGISLSVKPGTGAYIPLQHGKLAGGELDFGGTSVPEQIPMERALALLKPLLEDPSVLKVGQNLKYDMVILGQHGIRISPWDDTMLLSYVLDGGTGKHGMDALAEHHLEISPIKFEEVAGKGKDQVTFDRVPLDRALQYAAEDADITLRLWHRLKPRIAREKMATLYERVERPLVGIISDMESRGIKVDADRLRGLSQDFARRIERLEQEVFDLAGEPFTIGSPKQLGHILFEKLGLPSEKKTAKSKSYATGSEVLEPLAAQGHDIAAKVLDWRQLSKLKSTYTDALLADINPRTGRVHTSFSLAATNTGRLSSNDPNLQNIPIRTEEGRSIREAFVPEPGHVLLSADYSQIELRLVAAIADIGTLKQAFLDGIDIHAMTASQVFEIPLDQMDGETRRRAKAINFGIIYGISGFGLANQLGIPQSEASSFIKTYMKRFPELSDWMAAVKSQAKDDGFVSTLFGRKVPLPGIRDSNGARRSFAERQAINAPIQGTAADIIKKAMIQMPKALSAAGLTGTRMLLQVHDELIFETPEPEVDKALAVIKATMEGVATLPVPLVAEAGRGASWAEAH